jgi:PKD repeat protein
MKKKLIIILGWLMLLQGIVHLQAQSLNAWEYWFNDDYAGRVTTNIGTVSHFKLNTSIPASSLPAGMHTLHIRFRDTDGKWSTPLSQVFFKGGQHVASFEYWFNDDVEHKNTLAANHAANFTLTANISTEDIIPGMHQMHYRFKDAGGIYSPVKSRRFWKSGQTLTEFVYWFDDNMGAAVSGEMLGTVSETWNHEINVERGLNFDYMHLRFRDASEYWSSVLSIEAPPPLADFFAINDRYFVTFNNTTRLGTSFHWAFDDGIESTLVNPSHTYAGPGEYHVCLVAENKMGSDTLCRYVTLRGISSVMPEKAGNAGYATLTVNGGGLTETTTVVLSREGHQTIHADTTILMQPGRLQARFNLRWQTSWGMGCGGQGTAGYHHDGARGTCH